MRETGALKKLLLILFLVVLLPALFYSGYEVTSISTTEKLIGTIYSQQLDVILFSLNQYALDVANDWASSINILLNENRKLPADSVKAAFEKLLLKNSSIDAVMVSDSSLGRNNLFINSRKNSPVVLSEASIVQCLTLNNDKIERLRSYQKIDYRKIEPVQLVTGNDQSTLALVFVTGDLAENQTVVTIVLNEQSFIHDILSPKLQEASGDEFVLAVFKNGEQQTSYATAPIRPEELKQKKLLWLFPNYFLGISLKGATVEELVQSRFHRNLILIIIVDLVLIIGVFVVYRNIRRQIEFVRLKSDFVSNVSHELRTPLSLIRMFAETLDMDRIKSEEKKREYYSTILKETERLARLVDKILDFSRMEAGKKQYTFKDEDLNEIISVLLDTYSSHLQAEGFEPVIQLDPDLPKISADREAFTEAVVNLLDNAIKYSGANKYVRIKTAKGEKAIIVEIEDHGIGIAPEHQKKIFDNFYRVSDPLVHDTKGSGLGLALVKHIVTAHGGKIILTSAPAIGTTFRLEFPLTRNT